MLRLAPPIAGEPTLAVRCLGPLHVVADGRPLGSPINRRARSVLKYLVLHRGPEHAADVLMDLLWPDSSPRAARNNLNVAVHGLRRFLRGSGERGGHVLFDDGGYLINPELDLWVDLTEFEEHLARVDGSGRARPRPRCAGSRRPRRSTAARCSRTTCTRTGRSRRGRPLEDRYVDALAVLAGHYRTLGDDPACIRVSRKVLAVQPMYEAAHRHLMHAYARLDQHHLALRQYRECVSVLRTELRVPPAPETTRLNELIRLRRIV